MKTIRSENVRMRIMKNIYKMVFAFVLIFALVLTVPGKYHNVYAAPLEDCDLDGYDDSTGVPVPWPGYDETKGDTPEGRGGSKTPATAPGGTDSTKAGNSKSEAPGKTSGENSDKTNDVKNGSSNGTDSNKTKSTTSENTGNGNSVKSSKVNSGKKNNVDSGKTNSTVQDKTGKAESGKTSGTASNNTNSAATDNANSSVSSDENNQNEVSQGENEQVEVNSDNGNTVNSYTTEDEIEPVINTKGLLKITEATGSMIHAGSPVIISGSGFAGNIHDLEIETQPGPRQLGTVESSGNGSFEAKLNIPEDLEAGEHHIVVLYQGKEIARQQIEVGPKVADSFLQALSVGFTKDNKGLIPGLLILLGLFVSGAGVLGGNVLFRSRRNKS